MVDRLDFRGLPLAVTFIYAKGGVGDHFLDPARAGIKAWAIGSNRQKAKVFAGVSWPG